MNKTRIRVLSYSQYTPTALVSQVKGVYLDLGDDFDIRLTKQLEELSDLNKINQDVALSFDLPFSNVNDLLFQKFDIPLHTEDIEPLTVEIIAEDARLSFTDLYVREVNDEEQTYSVVIRGGNWLDGLDNCRLCDLSLGSYDYTTANVVAGWSNTSDLLVFPPVDYGKFREAENVTLKDLRPFWNVQKILNEAFCKIGWDFRSEFFESSRGSRLYNTLSPDEWYSYGSKKGEGFVELEVINGFLLEGSTTNMEFNVVTDPLGRWEQNPPVTGTWGYRVDDMFEGDDLRIVYDFFIELDPPPNDGDMRGSFLFSISGFGLTFYLFRFAQGPEFGQPTKTVRFQGDFFINPQEVDHIAMFGSYRAFPTGMPPENRTARMISGFVEFRTNEPFLIEDDTIDNVADLLDCEISALDVLKAATHFTNGRFVTDYARKIVYHYPPYDTANSVDSFEGYFRREGEHNIITDKVILKSRKKSIKREERDRYILLKYKDSKDEFVKRFSYPNDEYYSNRIDLGSGRDKEKKIENKLWEVSRDRLVDFGGENPVYLMVIWDNDNLDGDDNPIDEPKLTVNGGVRLAYHYGLVSQSSVVRELKFNGALIEEFGFMSMQKLPLLSSGESQMNLSFNGFGFAPFPMFYERYFREMFESIEFDYLVYVTLNEFLQLDFRKPYGIYYRGNYTTYQLLKARDFSIESDLTTPFTFIPINPSC